MKLPLSFNTSLILRLVLPGFLLALTFLPAFKSIEFLTGLSYSEGDGIELTVYLTIGTLFFGWLVINLDMQIYILFEGRRYWPNWIKSHFVRREKRRLANLEKMEREYKKKGENAKEREASIEIATFPLGKDGKPYIAALTRLGNIISEFEGYPDLKYGIDAVFYWPRIWVSLPKELKEDIDQQQAFVDSTVYFSFVSYVSAVVFLIYGLLQYCRTQLFDAGFIGSEIWVRLPWSSSVTFSAAFIALLAGFLVYRSSLQAHIQFGTYFKAVFDQHHNLILTQATLKSISKIVGDYSVSGLSGSDAYKAAWDYLRWHMAKVPGAENYVNIEELRCGIPPEPDSK